MNAGVLFIAVHGDVAVLRSVGRLRRWIAAPQASFGDTRVHQRRVVRGPSLLQRRSVAMDSETSCSMGFLALSVCGVGVSRSLRRGAASSRCRRAAMGQQQQRRQSAAAAAAAEVFHAGSIISSSGSSSSSE